MSDSATCTYCGQTGLSDWVKRRDCCALAAAQHKAAYDTNFNEFAGRWLQENLTAAEILCTPGVAEILLEANHNEIQEEFDNQDEDEEEDEEEEPDFDEEHEERKRIVQEVSRRVGGLTGSEVRDIMNDQ